MTMGLKIHQMLKDERSDPPEMVEEARKRKEMSDSILEIIYHKLMSRGKDRNTRVSVMDQNETEER
ncbi:MAG: hypothetical protein JW939_01885 [Candidatus Thermoplasmatota archaeon]|nr:hypothetical protein [Candidatus Thermoplasmatota archaeon]